MTIDKLAWVYIKNRKVLTSRSAGKDTWYIPGGKREVGETNEQALIREVKEELNVDLIPASIKYLGTFQAQAHGKPEGTFVQMTCYLASYKGKLKPSSEIAEISWHNSSVDPNTISPVDRLIYAFLKQKDLID